MQRFTFKITYRQFGEIRFGEYSLFTRDIGIAKASAHAFASINGMDVVEIKEIN